ncbi:MAG: hypothetical protein ACRDG6_11545 [Candidatus Limnocylindria bacterium]
MTASTITATEPDRKRRYRAARLWSGLLEREGVRGQGAPRRSRVAQLSRVLAKLEGVRDVFSVHRDGR